MDERDRFIALRIAADLALGRRLAERDAEMPERDRLLSRLSGTLEAPADEARWLEKDPSAIAAGELGRQLARYGLTPVTVIESIRAVDNFVWRTRRTRGLGPCETLRVEDQESPEDEVVTIDRLLREIGMSEEIAPMTLARVLDWIWGFAAIEPDLFTEFQVVRRKRGYDLVPRIRQRDPW